MNDHPSHCHTCGQRLPKPIRSESIDGRAILHHGDFRDAARRIDPESIDAVITDPPYGSGGFTVRYIKRPSLSTGQKCNLLMFMVLKGVFERQKRSP